MKGKEERRKREHCDVLRDQGTGKCWHVRPSGKGGLKNKKAWVQNKEN